MKKTKRKALQKNSLREILNSKARFFSILGIILLGVCFYGGIKATSPDMVNTAHKYYLKKNLMDTKVVSTLGIANKDIDILKHDKNILDFEPLYTKDVNLLKDNQVVRFYSYDSNKNKHINDYEVVKGRLPKNSGEIALDNKADSYKKYKIGDTFKIDEKGDENENFNTTTYKIIGFVNSPMYIENIARGNTNVGKGSIDYFAVISEKDFNMKSYTEVYIKYKNINKEQAYSSSYNEKVVSNKGKLKSNFKTRPKERLMEIKKQAEETIKDAKNKIVTGEEKLQKAKTDLENGRKKLEDGKKQLAKGRIQYNEKIKNGENQLESNSKQLENAKKQLQDKEKELANAKAILDKSKVELENGAKKLQQGGVDPNTDVNELEQKYTSIKKFSTSLNYVASDMTSTIESIGDGTKISQHKIDGWISQLNNPIEDLSKAKDGIKALSKVPMNENTRMMAMGIASQLKDAGSQAEGKSQSLGKLISVLKPYNTGKKQYEEGLSKYNGGSIKITEAKNQLINGEKALKAGKDKLEQGKIDGEKKLNQSALELKNGEKDLSYGENKIKEETKKLEDGKKKIINEENKLKNLKEPTYYFFHREDNPGYEEFNENAKKISSIATVFPVFFFMIAALVSLTTMTRMVDEKRGEIGTLKALGYSNLEIAQKYIIYATSASLIGSILGLFLGFNVFPNVIFNAYGSMYNLPPVIITYYWSYSIQSIVVSLICTLISALVVLKVDLFSEPAVLMRPKAPKAGQRILLERIPFIWDRLNFNKKVTIRNLFRYKQRMLMTVFGIAGCMALIVTGFGLGDSIGDVINIQFNKLWHYQGIVTYSKDARTKDNEDYEKALSKLSNYKDRLTISQESMQVTKKGFKNQEVKLDVPKTTDNISKFILFNNRKTGEKYNLTHKGAIINEKLAKMFKLKEGDTFQVKNNNNQKFSLKVDKIVENYAMHFIYVTPTYYEEIFNKKPEYNSDLILFNRDLSDKEENAISSKLMEYNKVINVTFLSKTSNAMNDSINSLGVVVWVLIISAGTLAFIVLYNLNNINISERIRELSTVKVLGLYDNEVTMYVYRENNILTFIGILVGCVVGKLFHGFVLGTAEVDMLMFSPTIHIISYVYSGLITILFSLIVMAVMHRKLYKIDMIEALKSNE